MIPKYRVWDGERMLYPGAPQYVAIGAISWGFWDGDELLAGNHNPNHKLLESIRRKDKKNKEIYEGDIIQSGECRGFVLLKNGVFEVERRENLVPYNKNKHIPYLDWPSEAFNGIIVGNIYENPELLEE